MSTIGSLVILSIIASAVQSRLSENEQCIRLKHLYGQIPTAIEMVTNKICAPPAATIQCVLMSKLALEYSRERIMELRIKSNCLRTEAFSSEMTTTEELCALLDSLPLQSVKLATKIFLKTPEKQLAQRFGTLVSQALHSLTSKIHTDLSCDDVI